MAVNAHKVSWKATPVRIGLSSTSIYDGNTLTGTRWNVAESVSVERPEDSKQHGRLIVIEMTPEQAEERARSLMAWAAKVRQRQQGL